MNDSLFVEYKKLLPAVKKIFVVPQILSSNKNTSYLYCLYDELQNNPSIEIDSFDAKSLPRIFLSRLKPEPTILHYHWFEFEDIRSLFGIKWKLFWIILYKILGGKIVWTIHNKYPHHNKYIFFNKVFRKILAKLANKLHVHCKTAIDIVKPILGVNENKFFIVKHPEFKAEVINRAEAVDNLNKKYFSDKLRIDDNIFLMFGAIAEYKGIKEVIEMFQSLAENKKLIIAGFVKKGALKYFNELKSMVDNKKTFIAGKMIPDSDVPFFLNSADCTIFNYRDILTSGGVYLALSYSKPVIAPLAGCLKELKDNQIHFFETGNDRIQNLYNTIKNFN